MASSAFNEFRYNVMDARRLLQAHGALHDGKPGKKGLGHITRSGVVMLCAAWEHYHESAIKEGAAFLANEIRDPTNLPLSVKKHLSSHVKAAKNEIRPMDLAGEGWRSLYVALAADEVGALNTPKSERLQPLYERLLGVSDVSTFWKIGAKPIDDFVSSRGDIAHRGRKSDYITAATLGYYIEMVSGTVSQHDNALCDYLKAAAGTTYQPWKRTA